MFHEDLAQRVSVHIARCIKKVYAPKFPFTTPAKPKAPLIFTLSNDSDVISGLLSIGDALVEQLRVAHSLPLD